jgi:hypothetical protein
VSDPIYDAWRAYRAQLIASLDTADAIILRKLLRELPHLSDAIAQELVRRRSDPDRQDARLYKAKGRPQ